MARVAKSAGLALDAPVCTQCKTDRANPTAEQKRKLAPPCWLCLERYMRTNGQSPAPLWPGCKDCLRKRLCDLDCARCRVWLHWTGLVAHGYKPVPFDSYPADFRIRYCAVFGRPDTLQKAATSWLVNLLWHQRGFSKGEPGPLERFTAELRRVFEYEPALLAPARVRFEQELAATRRFEKRRELPTVAEVLAGIPAMREVGEEG